MILRILSIAVALSLAAPGYAAQKNSPPPASGMSMPALDLNDAPPPTPEPPPAAAEPVAPLAPLTAEPQAPAIESPPVEPPPAETAGQAAPVDPSDLHLGLHVGVVLPQVASELGTAPGFTLEGGYRVVSNLSLVLGAGYTQPKVSTSGTDPRLPAGSYTTETTQRELNVTLGLMYRLLPAGSFLNGYVMVGARSYFLETITQGSSGGASFLENRETSTRFGGVGQLGGELKLGPGAVTLAAEYGGSALPHLITGDVQTSAITVSLGYRLLLL